MSIDRPNIQRVVYLHQEVELIARTLEKVLPRNALHEYHEYTEAVELLRIMHNAKKGEPLDLQDWVLRATTLVVEM